MVAGIDISKDKFDVETESGQTFVLDNVASALPKLKKALKGVTRVLMESTSMYHLMVAEYLHSQGFVVVVVNPARSHYYAKYLLRRNKTDKVDAGILCKMAKDESHRVWVPDSDERKELKGLLRVRDDIVKRKSAKQSQLKTAGITSFEKQFYKAEIASLKLSLKEVDALIEKLMKTSEELKAQFELLDSIPGFGVIVSAYALAYLPTDVGSARQAAAYVGLAPKLMQSGKYRGQTKISKMGNSSLRKLLYLSSWTASRTEGPLKEFYERMLRNGKGKQSAFIALAHKLVRIAFGTLSRQQPFDPKVLTKTQ